MTHRNPSRRGQMFTPRQIGMAGVHLSHQHFQVMQAATMFDYNYSKVAEHLGWKLGTVKSRLSRARVALAALETKEEVK